MEDEELPDDAVPVVEAVVVFFSAFAAALAAFLLSVFAPPKLRVAGKALRIDDGKGEDNKVAVSGAS